jgi:enoyl-CoA hydratase/carnithine racemase
MPNDDTGIMVELGPLSVIRLDRPRLINSLNLDMIRRIHAALEQALALDECRSVLIMGAGEKGFCAGGDIKTLWSRVQAGLYGEAEAFFREEYELDLLIHTYPKPVVVLAHGVTMGGGIGLAAGAAIVIATEETRMAMPETRIGFFPDVGATGWLHAKCPPGYPAFLGLTGYEMNGAEAVRLGLATLLIPSGVVGEAIDTIGKNAARLPKDKVMARSALVRLIDPYRMPEGEPRNDLDAWVAAHFNGKPSLQGLVEDLTMCRWGQDYCSEFLATLSERSPTALKLTHALLLKNRGRPLPEVFETELDAAGYMIRQHDYREGVRARVIDKDNAPRWMPARLEEVGDLPVF